MFSLSDSNPCRGAASRRGAELVGRLPAVRARLLAGALEAGALAGLRGPPWVAVPPPIRERAAARPGALLGAPVPAAASRAAVRRALERWGRVWGRLTRTSRSPGEEVDRWLPLSSLIQKTVAQWLVGGERQTDSILRGEALAWESEKLRSHCNVGHASAVCWQELLPVAESGRAQLVVPGLSIDRRNGNKCQ